MMTIKLIATDVDGTLLDKNSKLPDSNKNAIMDCKKNGIGVILATGKSISAISGLVSTLALDLPQITLNGAVVVDKNSNIIRSVKLDAKYCFELLHIMKEKKYKPLVALENGKIYYDEYDPLFEYYDNINERLFKVESLENTGYAEECVSVGAMIAENDPLEAFLREKYGDRLTIVRSGKFFFDILNKDTTKGRALSFICSKLDIRKSEVAAIGDSPNDISMFEFAGISIAMKNSFPEVLNKADYVTGENHQCGFAQAVYRYILKND
jgi:Cof subfamily protein (haloacid dehalogenase superfamily)